jgi:hypothetical protein
VLTSKQASPPTKVSTSSSTSALSSPPLRSVSAAVAPTSASSTPTGSTRTAPTSTTRSSSSTPSTRPSAVTPASTGSSTRCTSTVRLAVSPPPASSPVVSTVATSTTTPLLAAERPGRSRTPCPCGATGRRLARCGAQQAIVSVGSRLGCQTATICQFLRRALEDWAKPTIPYASTMGGNEKPTFNRILAPLLRFYDFFLISQKFLDQQLHSLIILTSARYQMSFSLRDNS